jgi:hypothetical protein
MGMWIRRRPYFLTVGIWNLLRGSGLCSRIMLCMSVRSGGLWWPVERVAVFVRKCDDSLRDSIRPDVACFNCHSPRDIAEAISDTHVNLCVTLSNSKVACFNCHSDMGIVEANSDTRVNLRMIVSCPKWPVSTTIPPGAMLKQIQKYVPTSTCIKWPVPVVTPLPGALLKQSVYTDYWFTDTDNDFLSVNR